MNPEELAFWEQIEAGPEDHHLKLIFADWLEEHQQDDLAHCLRWCGERGLHPTRESEGWTWRECAREFLNMSFDTDVGVSVRMPRGLNERIANVSSNPAGAFTLLTPLTLAPSVETCLTFLIPAPTLHNVLGTPDHIEPTSNDLHVWHQIGTIAYSESGGEVGTGDVTFIRCEIMRQEDWSLSPRWPFVGSLRLNGLQITRETTLEQIRTACAPLKMREAYAGTWEMPAKMVTVWITVEDGTVHQIYASKGNS